MSEITQKFMDRIRAADVDPTHFLEYAPRIIGLVATAGPDAKDELLTALVELAVGIGRAHVDGWSAFHFGAECIADVFHDDVRIVTSLTRELTGLVGALSQGKLTDSMALQRLFLSAH